MIALNLILHLATERLLYAQNKRQIDQRADQIAIQNNILANRIVSDGLDEYTMSQALFEEEDSSYNALESMACQFEGRIILLGSDFQVLADTYQRNVGKYIITEDTIKSMNGEKVDPKEVGDSFVQVITCIVDKDTGERLGELITLGSLKDCQALAHYTQEQREALEGLGFLISVVIGILLTIFLNRSLRGLSQNIRKITLGHQDDKISEDGFREIHKIAVDFNKVTTRYKELENSRQEFVSNVSHELKTPITSMKILADSLLMQDNVPIEIYEEFMEDIVHEIDRENQIITDLLDLVRLDKSKSDLNIAPANINELLETLLKRITPIAEERSITIHLETMRQVIAEVDVSKLSLACNNLIENAVKYNRDGGKVNVYLNADHKFFYIRVKDNGVGIPEDCQDKIFERFYRVDKARSRETGGTGLGLAITRNIVLLHKGSIKVHSKEGVETTFLVRIPLKYVG